MALDAAGAESIAGPCAFLADDGKIYVGTVEFVVSEANPEYVRDCLGLTPDGRKLNSADPLGFRPSGSRL